jgi:hypothetical protein
MPRSGRSFLVSSSFANAKEPKQVTTQKAIKKTIGIKGCEPLHFRLMEQNLLLKLISE